MESLQTYLSAATPLWVLAACFYSALATSLHRIPREWLRQIFEHPRPPSSGSTTPSLDGLRGIAILMVMSFHIFQWFNPVFGALSWNPLIRNGWSGVELFVTLSGYLIYGSLVNARERGDSLRIYFHRRFLRIFPVYLTSTLVAIALLFLHLSPFAWHQARLSAVADSAEIAKNILGSVSLIRGVNWSFQEILNPPAWSLGVEVTFYLIAPLVAAAASRKPLLAAAIGLIVLFMFKHFGSRELGIFYFFWVGILGYEILRHKKFKHLSSRALWLFFFVGCATTVWFLTLPLVDLQGNHLYPRHYQTGILALGLLLLIISAPRLQFIASILSIYPLRFIGIVSYSTFLLHFPWFSVIGIERMQKLSAIDAFTMLFLVILPATLFLSAISYAAIERRFIAFKINPIQR